MASASAIQAILVLIVPISHAPAQSASMMTITPSIASIVVTTASMVERSLAA